MVTQGSQLPVADTDDRAPRALSISPLFQPLNGPFSSGSPFAMEKTMKTDAAEALELSEKLVCGCGGPPPPLSAQH